MGEERTVVEKRERGEEGDAEREKGKDRERERERKNVGLEERALLKEENAKEERGGCEEGARRNERTKRAA